MIGVVLFVIGVVYGPVLRWAVRERRAEAAPVEPMPRMAAWSVMPGPRSRATARRVDAAVTEEWLAAVRPAWDADLTDLAERLRARTRPPAHFEIEEAA